MYFRSYFTNYDFKSKAELFALFDDYNSLSSTLESIYGRILDSYDKIKLARLIAALNMNEELENKPYNEEYSYFKLFHESLLVAKEGNSILFTARQLYFPDSISFNTTPFKKIPSVLVPKKLGFSKDDVDSVRSLVSAVVLNLNEVRKANNKTEFCQTAISKYLNFRLFNSCSVLNMNTYGPSFYICRDVDKIRRILQMRKDEHNVQENVYVDASINAPNYPSNYEAVRFSEIYVKLYRNDAEYVDLEEKMSNLTSSGFYDYKYNGEIYRIGYSKINTGCDYKRNNTSDDTGITGDYKILRDAKPLFSPYTTWIVSMSPINGTLAGPAGVEITNEFDDFDLSDVELHLVGKGTYLDSLESIDRKTLHAEVKVSEDYDIFNISKVKI